MSKECPILFSAEMVRALLDGSKTQTRRVVKMPPSWDCIVYADWGNGFWPYASDDGESPTYDNNEVPMVCPYGRPGDRLWVRETHRPIWGQTPGYLINIDYRADPREKWERLGDQIGMPATWTPSIHMRREYSRILLEIVSVRVERLNDISEADARAEGVKFTQRAVSSTTVAPCFFDYLRNEPNYTSARDSFASLWESINGTGSWDAKPWVWIVEFKRVYEPNKEARGVLNGNEY